MPTLRIAPYARISDTDEERAPGLDRQLRIVYPLIESRGGTPTHEYIDNDKSAYKPDVIRDEGFEPWLKDFQDGQNDGIAAFDMDRLFRQPSDLERVIRAFCEAYKAGRPKPVLWVQGGTFDLTDEDGQLFARMLVTFANASSGKTVKRMGAFYRDEALRGKIYPTHRAFYRNQDGSINPARRELVLKAVNDTLAGIGPASIAAEWRSLGIQVQGPRLTSQTVRVILRSPGLAGLAAYKGEVLYDKGQPIERQDGGVVDVDTWRQLQEILKPKSRPRMRQTTGLLSGVLRCGECKRKLAKRRRSDTSFKYVCQSEAAGGCGKVSISGMVLDKQITAEVLKILSEPYEEPVETTFEGESRLAGVTTKLAELWAAYQSGDVGPSVFAVIKDLEDEQRQLQTQAARHKRKPRKLTPAEEWDNLDLPHKQAVIAELFETIFVQRGNPNVKGQQTKYNPNRVQIIRRQVNLSKVYGLLRSNLALAV